ncbi:hypothetical protein ASPVEDRAFT_81757 [Aspergillus versicolor CBS 583.65]|uniref:Uncharacterized protein n=1 Tax=Aspergillus versicolor CBS 583.65 TaxID=1036611 RepID=A0A1L9PFF5_ASPVE|nr:uncharacterized protein ASPVEDRAFT_81757 [Aspergillus versicolor CBS 583.65]OJJ00176.1 hypothetical protein ASPVEDRAFT_81757 [Aspergillus versicolor CBS 583.65]
MVTPLDTLRAQRAGAGGLHGVLHVQRMVLLMAASCIPIGAHVASKAGSFIRMSFIGLPTQVLYEAGKRPWQLQGDFDAVMATVGLSTPINAGLSWFLAFNVDTGLDPPSARA